METLMSLAFMAFGFGFFMFVTRILARDHREAWQQRIMEAREFGVEERKHLDPPSRHKK